MQKKYLLSEGELYRNLKNLQKMSQIFTIDTAIYIEAYKIF